jgi:hypothetical protein
MPFSVSTCLTGLGTVTLGPTLTIYSNPIPPNNQGVFVGNVSTSLITGGACPYTFIVPDGTTTVRLFDPVTFCYADIPVSNNNVCSTCELNFDSLSNNILSTINVGNLTGSCDSTITDYRISWYGPNNPTQLAFTSGAGTIWTVRDANQPITPTSLDAPLLEAGTYVSKITDVELNGVRFSFTGGTNNVLSPSLLNCSSSTTVAPFNCSNGTNDDTYYKHFKQYITDGASTPKSYTATFSLSANTPAFIWEFSGLTVYDTLTLTFSGSEYTNPIILENFRLGGDAGTDLRPTTFPKRYASSESYRKVTKLTNLTVNNDDKIYINITPNPSYDATSYSLKFGCYGNPTATKTCLDDYKNKPYKIKASTILPNTNICGDVTISFSVSGCSYSDNSPFTTSDLVDLTTKLSGDYYTTSEPSKLLQITSQAFYSNRTEILQSTNNYTNPVCTNSGNNTITISKTNTTGISFFFSNINDLTTYYNDVTNRVNQLKTRISNGSAFVNDATNINFYRFFGIYYPTNTGNILCGDTILSNVMWFHCDVSVTSGTTSGGYTMFITTPLLSNTSYVCPTLCTTNCGTPNSWANNHNTTRNLAPFSITNTTGLKYVSPVYYSLYCSIPTPQSKTSQVFEGKIKMDNTYATNTYASSGNTNTLIPPLSATSWDWENHFAIKDAATTNPYYQQSLFKYEVKITSFTPLTYQIWAVPVSNFEVSGAYITTPIFDSTNPSAFNTTYVY